MQVEDVGPFTLGYSHVGFIVPDVARSAAELTATLGLTWASVRRRRARVADGGGPVRTVDFVLTYSQQGPPYVELVEAVPESLWAMPAVSGGTHHLGFWSSDVQADSDRLAGVGLDRLASCAYPDGSGLRWAYHRHEQVGLIELVDEGRRGPIEAWIAGRGGGA